MSKMLFLLILILGVYSVFRLPVWNYVDEGSHFNYIQVIAQNRRLPVLFSDLSSPEFFRLGHKTRHITDLGYHLYEAFQPPLYYLVATPFFFLSSNFHTKVILLRLFTFSLYLLTIFITLKLGQKIVPKNRLAPILILSVFLFPGMIIRNSVITNASLEMLLATIFIYISYSLLKKFHPRHLFLLSVILAFGILTKFTLVYLIPIYFLILGKLFLKKNINLKHIILNFFLLLLILSPWLIFNYQHFHSLTANSLAIKMQQPYVNPQNLRLPVLNPFKTIVIPEEWQRHFITNRSFPLINLAIVVIIFIIPLFFIGNLTYFLFFLPLLFALVFQTSTSIIYNWPANLGRYLYSALPPWIIFVSYVFTKKLKPRLSLVLTLLIFGGDLVLWFFLLNWYYLNPLFISY